MAWILSCRSGYFPKQRTKRRISGERHKTKRTRTRNERESRETHTCTRESNILNWWVGENKTKEWKCLQCSERSEEDGSCSWFNAIDENRIAAATAAGALWNRKGVFNLRSSVTTLQGRRTMISGVSSTSIALAPAAFSIGDISPKRKKIISRNSKIKWFWNSLIARSDNKCFFLLSYLVCSQIWLNHLMDDRQLSYIHKIEKKEPCA